MTESPRTVMVHGCSIHCRQTGGGPGDILLLHGKSFTAETWHDLGTISLLGEAGWRVTAVDLPGHGRSGDSPLPKEDFISRFMDAAGISAALIVAPSFSGWYAFPFMLGNPERITGFVGVAPRGIGTYRHGLHLITAPVLAVWGEHDDVVPLERADTLIAAVPDGQKIIMPGGSHAPYMGDPDGFHQHLLAFASKSL